MQAGWEAQWDVIVRVAYAMLLGGAIGLERERKDRPAGFRTHMLVAAAAAMLTGMGSMMVTPIVRQASPSLQVDPFRMVEAVIAGVAFIGAGTMFAHRKTSAVVGITTAASLLMVAVIGVAAGFGHGWLALFATMLALAALTVLAWVDRWMTRRRGTAVSFPPDPE